MSSKTPPSPYDLSAEECRKRFGSFGSSPPQLSIPDWHVEILEQRIAHYCEFGMKGTPWEEFENELFEMLRKG